MVLSEIDRDRLTGLADRLKRALTGQDHVIDLVSQRLQHGELGLTSADRPRASFLFLGPTGVGKTELTLRFSEDLIGPSRVVRLDMSEYQTVDRLALLLGSPTSAGRVAEGFDACQGRGTLLFDEIEKAHPRVLDLLLQLLDAGRLTTGQNRILNFSEWYVVLTSNIGAHRIMTMRKSKHETMERLVLMDAQRELRPEIFARLSLTVVFKKLEYAAQRRIAHLLVQNECSAQRTVDGQGQERKITFSPPALEVVIQKGYHEKLGARPMREAVEVLIRNALTEAILAGREPAGCLEVGENNSLRLNPSTAPATWTLFAQKDL